MEARPGRWKTVGAERAALAATLRRHYERDRFSIRTLAQMQDSSYGYVRRLLLESGTQLRRQGARKVRIRESGSTPPAQ
jgi:hypothetical protein